MNDINDSSDKAWAYAHGAMDPEARAAFGRELAQDPALRKRVDEILACHCTIRRLAALDETDDQLAERLLKTWEASTAGAGQTSPRFTTDEDGKVRRRSAPPAVRPTSTRFRFSRTVRIALLAAAFAFCGVVLLRQVPQQPIEWSEAEIIQQAVYRGPSGTDAPPRYSRDEMKAMTAELRKSVEFQYRDRLKTGRGASRPATAWKLSTRIQELESGRISVQVQAFHPKTGDPVKEWLKNFADASAFRNRVYEYSQQIVQDLWTLRADDARAL